MKNLKYSITLISIFAFLFVTLPGFCAPVADPIANLTFDDPNSRTGLATATDDQGNVWVRGQIPPALLSRQLVLQIPNSHITDYDLYIYQVGQLVRPERNTNAQRQKVQTRYPRYTFSTENPVYYLNIKKNPASKLKVNVQSSRQYFQEEWSSFMRIHLYYGLIIMAMIFNVVFFLIFLDRHFATYTLLQANLLLIFFLEDGMLHYFRPDMAQHFHYILAWATVACAVLAVMFTYYLLDLKQNSTWFKKVAFTASIVLLIGLLVYFWTGSPLIRNAVNISCFLLAILCFYQAAFLFKSLIYARFLLLAFGFLVLMGALYALNEFYGGPILSLFDVDGLRFASVVEIVAISFALIYKVRTLRKENQRYRTELRHYLELLQASRKAEKAANPITELTEHGIPDDTNCLLTEITEQFQLTDREKEVLQCIWDGASNQEISVRLNISINTAKFHVGKLYAKLDVKNRNEARMLKSETITAL